MDNKETENKKRDRKELDLDEMEKVSGGTLLIDGEPLEHFSRGDLVKSGYYHPKDED